MNRKPHLKTQNEIETQPTRRVSKKDQIISLRASGVGGIKEIATITGARPSYVASVLQAAGLLTGYFDLYTTTANPMNVYSRFFAGRLGFKDEATARQSVTLIDQQYRQFESAGDRAGQHHALVMALTMYDRARWTGKGAEADIFRQWLLKKLDDTGSVDQPGSEEINPGAVTAAEASKITALRVTRG